MHTVRVGVRVRVRVGVRVRNRVRVRVARHLVADREGGASALGGAGGPVARLRHGVDLCARA